MVRRWPTLGPDDILESPFVQRWGISYYVVFDAALDAFAPIVARLTGT